MSIAPYNLSLAQFSGPIEKLLELIEARELPVTEVSLAQVTDDFLKYLETLSEVPASLLADFIATASRLVLIKSKVLLPGLTLTGEEELQIKDLERRVRFYQELKPAMKALAGGFRAGGRMYAREYFLRTRIPGRGGDFFYPGTGLTAAALAASLGAVAEIIEASVRETKTVREKIITIEEKVAEILARLGAQGSVSFSSLSRERPAAEIIALFLAVLHLARERRISLEQENRFSDIMVAPLEGNDARTAGSP